MLVIIFFPTWGCSFFSFHRVLPVVPYCSSCRVSLSFMGLVVSPMLIGCSHPTEFVERVVHLSVLVDSCIGQSMELICLVW